MAKAQIPPVPIVGPEGLRDPIWPRWLHLLRQAVLNAGIGFDFNGLVKAQDGNLVQAVSGLDYSPALAGTVVMETSSHSAAAGVITPVSWETLTVNWGQAGIGGPFELDPLDSSVLICKRDGMYLATYSVQFSNADSTADAVDMWIAPEPLVETGDACRVSVPAKHGSTDGTITVSRTFQIGLAVDETVTFLWRNERGQATLRSYPKINVTNLDYRPLRPAVVLSLTLMAEL